MKSSLKYLSLCILILTGCNGDSTMHDASVKANEKAAASPATSEEGQENLDVSAPNVVAETPVAVGGAYLNCSYTEVQQQVNSNLEILCGITGLEVSSISRMQAQFFKVDGSGQRFPITIVEQDSLRLKWRLHEDAQFYSYSTILAEIILDQAPMMSFSQQLKRAFELTVNPEFFMTGEPNQQSLSGTGEDCLEMVNEVVALRHSVRQGVVFTELGRMNDLSCKALNHYLCKATSRGTSPEWLVSANKGPGPTAPNACPQDYIHSIPMTDAEIREVSDKLDAILGEVRVWMPMSDAVEEGRFLHL